MQLSVEVYIPRGSADATYRLVDIDDNDYVVAVVDPNGFMNDVEAFAQRLADAYNTANTANKGK
jgi:hypothetical protein